jgi:hypothetical protein
MKETVSKARGYAVGSHRKAVGFRFDLFSWNAR